MKEHNGCNIVSTLREKSHKIMLNNGENYIYSESALPNQKLHPELFDLVADFIRKSGGVVQ